MSFWDDIGDAVSNAADAVADAATSVGNAVESVVDAVGDAVGDAVETVGNVIQDGFNAFANLVGGIPIIGGALAFGFRWLGGVVSAPFKIAGAYIKGLFSIFGAVIGGSIKIIAGILTFHPSLILEGAIDIAVGIAGAIITVGGKFISFIQIITFLEKPERKLTESEKNLLKRIFWNSLALYNIRIVEGWAGIFSTNDRAFTLCNTIYLKGYILSDTLLVHECTHTWQYQHYGPQYASEAIAAQWSPGDAYDWEREIREGKTRWHDLNREAQAEFIEDLYDYGELISGNNTTVGNGVFYDAPAGKSTGKFERVNIDYTAFANDGVSEIRDTTSFRLSQFI